MPESPSPGIIRSFFAQHEKIIVKDEMVFVLMLCSLDLRVANIQLLFQFYKF